MITIHRDDLAPREWSGGRTWEFLLLPESGSYAGRDFDLRISSASVETPTSTFTSLPGIDRWLAVCSPIRLTIDGSSRTLQPGDVVAFRGEDDVTSVGACQDLNVMVRRGVEADVSWTDGASGPCWLLTADATRLLILAEGEQTDVTGVCVRL